MRPCFRYPLASSRPQIDIESSCRYWKALMRTSRCATVPSFQDPLSHPIKPWALSQVYAVLLTVFVSLPNAKVLRLFFALFAPAFVELKGVTARFRLFGGCRWFCFHALIFDGWSCFHAQIFIRIIIRFVTNWIQTERLGFVKLTISSQRPCEVFWRPFR